MFLHLRLYGIVLLALILIGCGEKPITPTSTSPTPVVTAVLPTSSQPEETASAAPEETQPVAGGDTTLRQSSTLREQVEQAFDELAPQNQPGYKLRTLGQALAVQHQKAPSSPKKTSSQLSWRVHLLPFLTEEAGAAELYREFRLDEPWDSPHNRSLVEKMPRIFGVDPEGKTRFHQLTLNPSNTEEADKHSSRVAILWGHQNTADFWTKPGDLPVNLADPYASLTIEGMGFTFALVENHQAIVLQSTPQFLADMLQLGTTPYRPPEEEANSASKNFLVPADLSTLPPPSSQIDLRHVPQDTIAVLHIQPRRIFGLPYVRQILDAANFENQPAEQFLQGLVPVRERAELEGFGLSLPSLDDITLIATAESLGLHPNSEQMVQPTIGARFRSARSLDVHRLVRKFCELTEEVELVLIDEFTTLIRNSGASLTFVDEHTFLMGQESVVRAMINAHTPSDSPPVVASMLKAAQEAPLAFVAYSSPAQSLALSEMTAQLLRGPLFAPFVAQARAIHCVLAPTDDHWLRASFQLSDDDWASQWSDAIEALLGGIRGSSLVSQRFANPRQHSRWIDLLVQLIENPELKVNANTVVLRLPPPPDSTAFREAVANLLNTQRRRSLQEQHLLKISLALTEQRLEQLVAKSRGQKSKYPDTSQNLSWRVALLPYLGKNELYAEFQLSESWDSPHNRSLLSRMPKIFGTDQDGKTRIHRLVLGKSTAPGISVVEAGADTEEFWTKPGELIVDPAAPLKSLGLPVGQDDGFYAVFEDGSFGLIAREISPLAFMEVLRGETSDD